MNKNDSCREKRTKSQDDLHCILYIRGNHRLYQHWSRNFPPSCLPTSGPQGKPTFLRIPPPQVPYSALLQLCPSHCKHFPLFIYLLPKKAAGSRYPSPPPISNLSCCLGPVSLPMKLKGRQGHTGRKKGAAHRNFWAVVKAYKWGGSQKRRKSRRKEQT